MNWPNRATEFGGLVKRFGALSAARMVAGPPGVLELRSPELRHPVGARTRSSDPQVFIQVLMDREYLPISELPGVESVIDLGANVGYSSAFFLSRYPAARCVAMEPDPANFSLLSRNLAPYGDRAVCVRGGAWNRRCNLALSESVYRDGAEWTRQVRECPEGTAGSFPGFDVPSLMDMIGARRVSILKVDIEGAEAVVFDGTCASWIDAVDSLAIELHDDSDFGMCSPVFWRAVADRGFSFARSGELVIARRQAASGR
jgi:FkbM family methyltransferase